MKSKSGKIVAKIFLANFNAISNVEAYTFLILFNLFAVPNEEQISCFVDTASQNL